MTSRNPIFAVTPNVGSGIVPATLDTSLTAPTNATTIFTAGSAGAKIEEIVVEGLGTTVAGLLTLFVHDGSTYLLVDTFTITAVTVSATVAPFRASRKYANLILENGWTLRIAQTIAGNQSLLRATAFGGDF